MGGHRRLRPRRSRPAAGPSWRMQTWIAQRCSWRILGRNLNCTGPAGMWLVGTHTSIGCCNSHTNSDPPVAQQVNAPHAVLSWRVPCLSSPASCVVSQSSPQYRKGILCIICLVLPAIRGCCRCQCTVLGLPCKHARPPAETAVAGAGGDRHPR